MTESKNRTNEMSNRESGIPRWIVVCLISLLIVSTIFFTVGLLPYWIFNNKETAGQFGDSFGFINALFSGLAFAGVIVTLLMQMHELKYQREELRSQREEMKMTRQAHEQLNDLSFISSYLDWLETVSKLAKDDEEQAEFYDIEGFKKQQLTNLFKLLRQYAPQFQRLSLSLVDPSDSIEKAKSLIDKAVPIIGVNADVDLKQLRTIVDELSTIIGFLANSLHKLSKNNYEAAEPYMDEIAGYQALLLEVFLAIYDGQKAFTPDGKKAIIKSLAGMSKYLNTNREDIVRLMNDAIDTKMESFVI